MLQGGKEDGSPRWVELEVVPVGEGWGHLSPRTGRWGEPKGGRGACRCRGSVLTCSSGGWELVISVLLWLWHLELYAAGAWTRYWSRKTGTKGRQPPEVVGSCWWGGGRRLGSWMEQHRGPERVCDYARSGVGSWKDRVAGVHSYLQGYILSGMNSPRHDILCALIHW